MFYIIAERLGSCVRVLQARRFGSARPARVLGAAEHGVPDPPMRSPGRAAPCAAGDSPAERHAAETGAGGGAGQQGRGAQRTQGHTGFCPWSHRGPRKPPEPGWTGQRPGGLALGKPSGEEHGETEAVRRRRPERHRALKGGVRVRLLREASRVTPESWSVSRRRTCPGRTVPATPRPAHWPGVTSVGLEATLSVAGVLLGQSIPNMRVSQPPALCQMRKGRAGAGPLRVGVPGLSPGPRSP